jgi:hypothetical protein
MDADQLPPKLDKDAPRRSMRRLVRLPSVERGCDGKTNLGRSYAKQADKLAAKHGKKYGVYRCPHCGGTHLTTKLSNSEEYAGLLHISPPNCGAFDTRKRVLWPPPFTNLLPPPI